MAASSWAARASSSGVSEAERAVATSAPGAAELGRGPVELGRAAGRWIGRRWPGRVVVPLARLAMTARGPPSGSRAARVDVGPGRFVRGQRIAPAVGHVASPAGEYVRANPRLLDSNCLSEDPRIDLDALIGPNLSALVVGLIAAVLALATACVILARRTRDLEGRLSGITRGAEGRSLEAVLDTHLQKVFAMSRELDDLVARTAILEAAQSRSFQRVGLVRYNPFEETGGNQSFALALLDAAGNGWVLSSLHARSGTRVYAKSIIAGRSDAGLSAEESAALAQATA